MGVRLRDGVEIDVAVDDGGAGPHTLVADGTGGDVAALSHAHGDHLFEADRPAVCSALTARLARRRGAAVERTTHPAVELVPAGHVAGSRAIVVTGADGRRVCYTGDVCTRDRFYLDGFDPAVVDADVLIIEATYGRPEYVFPPVDEVADAAVDWLVDTAAPVLLFGYALGRAQKLQMLTRRAGRDTYVSDAIADLNAVVGDGVGVAFDAERFDASDGAILEAGEALVLPSQLNNTGWVDALVERSDAVTVGVSGWAVEDAYKYRGDYDRTFALSDHCDFRELLALVEAVDPETVYTQHGFAAELADHLVDRGYDATALVRDQTTLGDF